MPDKRGGKADGVLRDAMAKKGLLALGFVVLRTRQHFCAVVSEGNVLALELLRFDHELRPVREVSSEAPAPTRASEKELALAKKKRRAKGKAA